MKKDIHPKYQEVLFVDSSTGFKIVVGSTLQPQQTEVYEGQEYPVQYVSVSSASHPFFTKSKQFMDTEGRVDKFLKRYAKKEADMQQLKEGEEKESVAKEKVKKSGKKKK